MSELHLMNNKGEDDMDNSGLLSIDFALFFKVHWACESTAIICKINISELA